MSTHDMSIANSSGAAVRADINSALQALASTSKDSSRPGTVYDGQLQLYTATTPWTLDIYDGSDYIPALYVDASNNIVYPYACAGNENGITIANNGTDPNNDIDFAAGTVRTSGNHFAALAATMTKRLDAAWAAGSGNGGLDTGSKANSTTYHCYLIVKTSDKSVDCIFSTGATGPTVLPSGYAEYRRRGAVVTDGSGNIRPFVQRGNEFRFATPVLDVDLTTSPSGSATYTMSVANGLIVLGRFTSVVYVPAAPLSTYYFPYYGSTGATELSWVDTNKAVYAPFSAFTSAAKQIQMSASGAVACTQWDVQTLGWLDYQLDMGV